MGKPALIKLLILACLAAIVSARPSEEVDLTPLEGTEERDPSKITLKHSIAYHFVKHTRSVEADIFVSRKINLSPITDGLITMQDVEERISNLCKQIPEFLREAKEKIEEIEASKPQFYYYPTEGIVSYWPARRHCEARGHQLPEIYDDQTNVEFLEFMRLKKVASTFMGVQYDRNTQIHRFVSTGLPIWAMYHKHLAILQIDGKSTLTQWSEANHQEYARFLYTQKGEVLLHSEDSHKSYAYKGTARSDSYLQQVKASVICQLKWKGGKMLRMPTLPEKWSGRDITVPDGMATRIKRDVPESEVETTPLQDFCYSVSGHLTETIERSSTRLAGLLALVDISIDTDLPENEKVKRDYSNLTIPSSSELDRIKRGVVQTGKRLYKVGKTANRLSRAGPVFALTTGFKAIWSLFGFIEKIRTDKRLKSLERAVSRNTEAIDQLSKEVASHSIAIDELNLVTQELTQRLDALNGRVEKLERKVAVIETEMRIQ